MIETPAAPAPEPERRAGSKRTPRRGRQAAARVPLAQRMKEADLTPGE